MSYEELQPDDDTTRVVEQTIANRRDRVAREHELSREAYVRELIRTVERALSGESNEPVSIEDSLAEIVRVLPDDDLDRVLQPSADCPTWAQSTIKRLRHEGAVHEPLAVFEAVVEVARALGYMGGYADKSRYAPVVLETLDVPGAGSRVREGQQAAVGRRRLAASSTLDLDDARVSIPHWDCEHVMVVANPRQGKDSTICRICGNLKREHGYKWISVYDDGRHETPLIALPNDDPAIEDNLADFGQEPRGYETTVYVPAVDELPDELPANHQPFSIGLDTLSPDLVAALAGEEIESESTQRRIDKALTEAREADGSVETLLAKLQTYAEETTAEVEVESLRDDDEIEGDSEVTHSYHMGEDELLSRIAESLMLLAAEGLLRDAGADTNLDMADVIREQDSVAVLNANAVEDSLKYLLTDLWLQLVYRARDRNPRLPRVALEVRELKNLAPSKLGDSAHSHIIKSLQQTFFFLSSQGGSRRIMILGSTQKLNDVYKPVRGNMPIKILLQLGPEKISTLEQAGYSFSHEQRRQLNEFPTGWGMLMSHGNWYWPIQWAGAHNALGIGDLPWQDRYAEAAGFRVASASTSPAEWYDVTGEVVEDRSPEAGEWYLHTNDVEEYGGFETAVEGHRDERAAGDLRLQSVEVEGGRNLDLLTQRDRRGRLIERIRDQHEFPSELESWLEYDLDKIDQYLNVLRAVRDAEAQITSYSDFERHVKISGSTVSKWRNRDPAPLADCLRKGEERYYITSVGERAFEIPWREYLD